jgi:hypothetical protein
MVDGNQNQYKPCEIFGRVVASSDLELCKKHGLNQLHHGYLMKYVECNGNVDVKPSFFGHGSGYNFIKNDYGNTNESILTVDKAERFELRIDEFKKMNRSHITLGFEDGGYNVILKNRYGKSGTIYTWEDIEQIKEEAYQKGISDAEEKLNNET